jgi:predicted O-methyltransferase YrrM
LLFRYLRFLLKSTNEHGVHSPFVFELYTRVIRPDPPAAYYCFQSIEHLRQQLLASSRQIQVLDLGAGSRVSSSKNRKIATIARHAEKSARFGQLLFRLVNHFQPQTIFDLGTSLGITTMYLAAPQPRAQVYTFEGCPQTLRVAQENFSRLNYTNIRSVPGNIDETLPATLARITALDFVFFDANHRREPTLRYFQLCLEKAHEESVFVFDDIYWSEEMAGAWQEIKAHPAVSLTIDLFFVGLVFFRKKQPRQHFVLRF